MKQKMKSAIGLFLVLAIATPLRARMVSRGANAASLYQPVAYVGYAQAIPSGDELKQLVAPFALFPDALVAQICAASTDPQQILDAHDWLQHNKHLHGQALTDAAQQQGFDPAFVSLVNFPTVLDMMAANINNYAALGDAFRANQPVGNVGDSVASSGRIRQRRTRQQRVSDSLGPARRQRAGCSRAANQSANSVRSAVSTVSGVVQRSEHRRRGGGVGVEFWGRDCARFLAQQQPPVGLGRLGLGR